jgi:hypothetical protein
MPDRPAKGIRERPMRNRPAKGIRGCLIANQDDPGFVFRVFGETDPATGQREFTDYELAVDDLWIEITGVSRGSPPLKGWEEPRSQAIDKHVVV